MSNTLFTTIPNERANSYNTLCQQSRPDAAALYLWGIDMAAALHEVLSMTEVAVRSAIDDALQEFAKENGVSDGEWIREITNVPYLPLITFKNGDPLFPYERLRTSIRRQEKGVGNGHPRKNTKGQHSHGDLVSHVMFGQWGALLPDRQDDRPAEVKIAIEELWEEAIKSKFPHQIKKPRHYSIGQAIGRNVRVCVTLRNRVNHVDSLLNVNVIKYFEKTILPLLQAINPDLKRTVEAHSRVQAVWHRRPLEFSGEGLDLFKISQRH